MAPKGLYKSFLTHLREGRLIVMPGHKGTGIEALLIGYWGPKNSEIAMSNLRTNVVKISYRIG